MASSASGHRCDAKAPRICSKAAHIRNAAGDVHVAHEIQRRRFRAADPERGYVARRELRRHTRHIAANHESDTFTTDAHRRDLSRNDDLHDLQRVVRGSVQSSSGAQSNVVRHLERSHDVIEHPVGRRRPDRVVLKRHDHPESAPTTELRETSGAHEALERGGHCGRGEVDLFEVRSRDQVPTFCLSVIDEPGESATRLRTPACGPTGKAPRAVVGTSAGIGAHRLRGECELRFLFHTSHSMHSTAYELQARLLG